MARPEYPMAGVVGEERVKLALSLLSVNPFLRGVVIRGGRGTGKSIMARAIRPLLAPGAPFIEVPQAVTVDRLLGGMDWTAALAGGKSRVHEGLLGKANGGVLFADHVNLLPLEIVAHIAGALCSGVVHLERDGLSSHPATSFVLLAAYDPQEGEPPSVLLDAVGLHVEVDSGGSPEDREMVARRALAFQAGPDHFIEDYVAATALEAARVSTARQLLQDVTVGPDARRQLCERASELGVEGNRTEVFALHTARAHAALRGHGEVEECDVRAASELVIEPRARTTVEGARSSRAPLGQGTTSTPAPTRGGAAGEWRAPPIDNPVPALTWPARATGAGATAGGRMRRRAESEAGRGRYVGALETDPGHGTVAVDATLRAAAPFQQVRQSDGRQLRILAGDLRYKRFRRKTGVGIVIALDASGSMANNRIQQAKGAIIRLLREVYVHRDSVALVAFRGDRAELLMKLGRSVELARRALDDLPAGGGTPLASGILCALDETRHTTVPTLLVLLTDGKPNVSGTGEPVWVELERVAQAVRQSKSVPIVIDTSRGHPSSERLAAMLDAKYLVLPRMDAAAVYQRVSEAASAMR